MKKLLLFVMTISVLLPCTGQTVFLETFDGVGGPTAGGAGTYTFPANWILANVDNLTPAASVSYVNDAWERREDFNFSPADSAAFSTSWYNPAGTADDWMWTPPITLPAGPNGILSWNAVAYDPAYPDGYEVRIMTSPNTPTGSTGVLGNMVSASTVLYSTAAENSSWTAHSVSLSSYGGQTFRIGFRNNSNDKFLLLIDDVKVEVQISDDVSVTNTNTYPDNYYFTPLTQAHPLSLSATVTNNGVNTESNVTLYADVFKDGVSVYSNGSSPVASLASGATTTSLTAGSYTPSAPGEYQVRLIAQMQATDQNNANDTFYSQPIYVTDSTYSRATNTITGALGIGAGTQDGVIATMYNIYQTAPITSVSYFLTSAGDSIDTRTRVKIYDYDINTNLPGNLLYTSPDYTYPVDSAFGVLVTMPVNPPLVVTAGSKIYVGIEEHGTSTMSLAETNDIFTDSTTRVNWTGAPYVWGTVESYGPSFAKSFLIRPNFGEACPAINSTITAQKCAVAGSVTLSLNGGVGPYTYAWSNSGTDSSIAGVNAGSYSVQISSSFCNTSATFSVPDSSYSVAATTSEVNVNCATAGSVSATATTGTSPYSYIWNSGSGATIPVSAAGIYTVTVSDVNGCSGTATATVGDDGTPVNATVSANSSTCTAANGAAAVTVTSGASPYTYLWSNGSTNDSVNAVTAGSYNVTITDANGCSGTASGSVTSNTITLTVAPAATQATCTAANGSVSTTLSNGTSPYTYAWSNGGTNDSINAVTPGTYTVSVTDANGCSGTATAQVASNAVVLNITASSTLSQCASNTGTASASIANGSSPFTYLWSNSGTTDTITALGAGSYTVTITDANGCSGSASASVTTPTGPSGTTAPSAALCNGGSTGAIVLTASGGTAPINYLWSNGATTRDISNVAAGSYTVTITDANGCSSTVTATVTEPTALALTGSTTDATAPGASDGSITPATSGGTPPYSYNPSTLTGLAAGTYTVTVTDGNGCTATQTFTINEATGLNNLSAITSLNVYPNPTAGQLFVSVEMASANDLEVSLHSVTGALLYTTKVGHVTSQTFTIPMNKYAAGVYTLQIKAPGAIETRKIILQR